MLEEKIIITIAGILHLLEQDLRRIRRCRGCGVVECGTWDGSIKREPDVDTMTGSTTTFVTAYFVIARAVSYKQDIMQQQAEKGRSGYCKECIDSADREDIRQH